MITIATYRNLTQAEIGKSRLKAENIEAFLADQATAIIGYGPALEPIRLQVSESDAERAAAILSKNEAVGLPDDFDPGPGSINDNGDLGAGPASDRSVAEEMRRLSRTVQNSAFLVVVALLLACIYISFKFRAPYRVNQERNEPSWRQVQNAVDRLEYDDAIRQAHVLIAKSPTDYYSHAYMTYLFIMVGDLPHAEQEARRTYEIFPTEEYRHRLLAVEQLQRQAATNTAERTRQHHGADHP